MREYKFWKGGLVLKEESYNNVIWMIMNFIYGFKVSKLIKGFMCGIDYWYLYLEIEDIIEEKNK